MGLFASISFEATYLTSKARAPWLSPRSSQRKYPNKISVNSLIQKASRVASVPAMSSISVVLSAIVRWTYDAQETGEPNNRKNVSARCVHTRCIGQI